jgi:phosphoribosylanthranilate isomerase
MWSRVMSKVKICGLSRVEDIIAVNRALPDFIGFVLAPSRRRVDIQTAAMLKKKLDPRIEAVGVFVNEDIGTVIQAFNDGIIDMVQLHGDEDEGYVKKLKESCGCPVIKAVGVGDALPPLPSEPDYLLFDTLSTGRGGAGKAFDWNLLLDYRERPYFVAGGLAVDTVTSVIGLLSPFCVDVSSGVETNGVKDEKKMDQFVNTVRRI